MTGSKCQKFSFKFSNIYTHINSRYKINLFHEFSSILKENNLKILNKNEGTYVYFLRAAFNFSATFR